MMKYISIIVPVYNEEGNINALYQKLKDAIEKINKTYEVIFIDDGSSDKSFSILSQIAQKDDKVKIIQFQRNLGQTACFACGIKHSTGEIIVTIDADLQNDPQDIPRLVAKVEEGYGLVNGWRKRRKDSLLARRIPSRIANKLISWTFGGNLHDYGCSLRAFRRQFFDNIGLYGEMHRFIPVFALWKGAKITEMEIGHFPRKFGRSNYSLSRIPKVLLDLTTLKFILSYLPKPMYVFGGCGIFFIFIGSISAIFTIIRKIFFKGIWMSPMLFISLICIVIAFQFILMGLLAELLSRVYFEFKDKISYVIKKKINF